MEAPPELLCLTESSEEKSWAWRPVSLRGKISSKFSCQGVVVLTLDFLSTVSEKVAQICLQVISSKKNMLTSFCFSDPELSINHKIWSLLNKTLHLDMIQNFSFFFYLILLSGAPCEIQYCGFARFYFQLCELQLHIVNIVDAALIMFLLN